MEALYQLENKKKIKEQEEKRAWEEAEKFRVIKAEKDRVDAEIEAERLAA